MRHAYLNLIGMRWQANGLPKHTSQMERAQIGNAGKRFQGDILGMMFCYVCFDTLDGWMGYPIPGVEVLLDLWSTRGATEQALSVAVPAVLAEMPTQVSEQKDL